jgi:hypothetical protein
MNDDAKFTTTVHVSPAELAQKKIDEVKKPLRDERGRLLPGQVANPRGRKPGLQDRRRLFNKLIMSDSEELLTLIKNLAKQGNTDMLKLLSTRMLPARAKDDPRKIKIEGKTWDEKGRNVWAKMEEGELSFSEANLLSATIANMKIIEIEDIKYKLNQVMQFRDQYLAERGVVTPKIVED